ncbi:FixH family protein [Aliikangiella coralliicola]|uniref:FixH family protein n=1 Tax=Aliikangiella coralliicola TaxID=2592383 RepID=A0A545UDF2_9GAMM|nr:FixH family protein [Aliikangiella coralliicola]TQV87495.1 FixH family protein [Aliikangiella coralliicola]
MDSQQKPWFKQFWPWLVFSIPLLTIVAGVITFQIASDQPHSMVQDDYFKKGLAINQSLAKQAFAKELNLSAQLEVDTASQLLVVKLNGEQTDFRQLKLTFSHPTQQKLDQNLQLEKLSAQEYVAQLPELPQAYWHIRLLNDTETWLLKSRWHYPESSQLTISTNGR